MAETAASAAEAAAPIASKAAEQATKAAEQAGKAGETLAEQASSRASKAAAAASEQASKAASAASEQASKAAAEAQRLAGIEAEAGASGAQQKAGEGEAGAGWGGAEDKEKGAPPQPPLWARLYDDAAAMFVTIKDSLGSQVAAAQQQGPAKGVPIDADTSAVTIREPTFWEKTFNTESAFFSRFKGAVGAGGDAAGGAGDRVFAMFGETEQAEAMRELRLLMPDFQQDTFLAQVSNELGPSVIGAYLRGDDATLRAHCREQAYATLHASVIDRTARQLQMDPRVLHMSEPELEGIRIIGGFPTPIVSFETHQLHCVRNALTGEIAEGSEEDIRAVYYLWALQPNEEYGKPAAGEAAGEAGAEAAAEAAAEAGAEAGAGEPEAEKEKGTKEGKDGEEKEEEVQAGRWVVTELAVRGMMEVY